MTAEQIWIVGLFGPPGAVVLLVAIAAVVALVRRAPADDGDDADIGPILPWYVHVFGVGALLCASDTAIAAIVHVDQLHVAVLGGALAGLASGYPLRVALHMIIAPPLVLVIPFALNLLALWALAY